MQTTYQKNRHHYGEILTVGLPIIIGQLGTIVLGFADTLMIGRHSTHELAAAGLVNNIFALLFITYLGFSYGLTPVVGQLLGKGQEREIGGKVKNSLAANLFVGLVFTLLMAVLYLNLGRIGQPDELLSLIRPYFLVNMASILFVGVFNTLKQFLDGIMHPKVSMWVMIAGNLLNILGNWLLIYGVAFFPEMGLLGAGLSTLLSRVFMAAALVVMVAAVKAYRRYRDDIVGGRVNAADFSEMNRLGWPVALQMGMESAAFTLSCVMAGWLGTLPLAAHQIMITTSQLFYLILSGMAAAMSIRVSHFVGQHDFGAVKLAASDCLRLCFFISALLSVPVYLYRHQLGGIFSDNVEVQQMVAQLVIVLIVYQFGDGVQYSYANALRGIACVKPLVPCAFIAYFVISLPLGYTLGFVFRLGLPGIWIAFPVGLTTAGLLYWLRFRRELRGMTAGGANR